MNDISNLLVHAMFDEPWKFRSLVEKQISRNSKLSSKRRRELTSFAYGALKWRDRLWKSKPENIEFDQIQKQIETFQQETLEQIQIKMKSMPTIEEQSAYFSYPKWMLEKWIQDFGFDQAVEIAWTQNQNSDLCIRVNGLQDALEKVQQAFQSEGVEVRKGKVSGAYYFCKKENVRGLHLFKRGFLKFKMSIVSKYASGRSLGLVMSLWMGVLEQEAKPFI